MPCEAPVTMVVFLLVMPISSSYAPGSVVPPHREVTFRQRRESACVAQSNAHSSGPATHQASQARARRRRPRQSACDNRRKLDHARACVTLGGPSQRSGAPATSHHASWATRGVFPVACLGVTSRSAPEAKSKTNPRITTSEGIHGWDLSLSTCFCVASVTSV
jgi:hypothetical protein